MFSINILDAGMLPTTVVKLLNALRDIVVTVHTETGDDVITVTSATERDGGWNLWGVRWMADAKGTRPVGLCIPSELVTGITVH
jgi:hypothetical protein